MNRVEAIEVAKLLKNLIEVQEISIILNTFLKAFEQKSIDHKDGRHYLHGNFNIGGTVSARMSSSKPNLQNLPSNSKYGKLVKKCFSPPEGWLLMGADFNALEAKINALLTKDHNKVKIYTDGYDSHSLMAYTYYSEQMPEINEKLSKLELKGKFYRITYKDGKIDYVHESEINT